MITEERIEELKNNYLKGGIRLETLLEEVAVEVRREEIEGKVINISWKNLRPIDGKGPPRYILQVDTEYETFEERTIALTAAEERLEKK